MVERLFVVIGAGASRGCAPDNVGEGMYLPPLVTDLFTTNRVGYSQVLQQYPLASRAAADLRGADTSIAIEEVIRERYRDSTYGHYRQMFRGILPYLQELLFEVSYRYTKFPQNYESLVTNLLRLPEVVFISLNYDVILDNVLRTFDPNMTSMSWYVHPDRHWSLVKLHGSVNWARNTTRNERTLFTDPPLDLGLDGPISLRDFDQLYQVRGFNSEGGTFMHGELMYPVLSVPVGQADELACPDEHVGFLQEKLRLTQPLHVLLIGYSGVDREVATLIRDSERGIKTLTVIDQSAEAGQEVAWGFLERHRLGADHVDCPDGGFGGWVESGGLAAFVDRMAAEAV